jgi:GGDEF domain-containing protein
MQRPCSESRSHNCRERFQFGTAARLPCADVPGAARGLHFITPAPDAERIRRRAELTTEDGMSGSSSRDTGTDPETGLLNRQGLTRRARELLWLESLQHGVMACLVVRVQVDAGNTTRIAEHCAATLRAAVRLSDVIARLAPTDFAVVAPDTDARGARKLASRLIAGIQEYFATPEGQNRVRITVGYEVVSSLSRAPIGAEALLLRATTAVRTGRTDGEHRWIRRFTDVDALEPEPAMEQLVGA